MTTESILRRLRRYARPAHNWIVLGDGSICIRDCVAADPVNVLAVETDPTYAWRYEQDDVGDEAHRILHLTPLQATRWDDAVSGTCGPQEEPEAYRLRRRIMHALNMVKERKGW